MQCVLLWQPVSLWESAVWPAWCRFTPKWWSKHRELYRTPGVTVETPYWRHHHPDENWQARQEFRDRQYSREEWLREHCVRDWSGGEYCRR